MKRQKVTFGLLLLILSTALPAQPASHAGFEVRLVPLSKEFVIGRPMRLRLEIRNTTDTTLGYTRTAYMVNDPLSVTDPNGRPVPFMDSDSQTGISLDSVEPGETVVLADDYDLRLHYHITRPGRYTVQFKGGHNLSPSNRLELEIRPGPLADIEGVVEQLRPILPDNWGLTRSRFRDTAHPGRQTDQGVIVHLVGKPGRKATADRGVFILLFIAPPPSCFDQWDDVPRLLGDSPWGPVYITEHEAQILWPDYRRQIEQALNIKSPETPARTNTDTPSAREPMQLQQHPREPILFRRDIPYAGTDNPRQRLDLYLPSDPYPGRLPVIVFVHGGAWMAGNKGAGGPRLAPFVRTGQYAGVSINYRLTDEAAWPDQIHDCKAAVRWVRAHADQYNLDPNRVAAWGESAGAHLALTLGVTGDAPALEGDLGPHTGQSSKISGVVNFFGPADLPAMIGPPSDIDHSAPDAPEARLIGGAVGDNPDKARAASPVTYVTPGDPPVLTLHGTADRIVPFDQARQLDKALSAAGVPHWFIPVTDAGHGGFPPEAFTRTEQFLGRILLEKNTPISTEPINKN